MNTMTYKGLSARVEFDAEDEIFVGRLAGINDVVGFHADTAIGLKEAFHEAVDGYLEACASVGKEPERAFSGKLMLRVKPELHQRLALAAELAGTSLNQLGEEVLSDFLVRRAAASTASAMIGDHSRFDFGAPLTERFARAGDEVRSWFGADLPDATGMRRVITEG